MYANAISPSDSLSSVSSMVQMFTTQPPPPPPAQQSPQQVPQRIRKKRGPPAHPDLTDVEVIALTPVSLMTTNRYICDICNKGFQRDQNLQLHRRGHSLPYKLKQKSPENKKKVFVCPIPSCVHHDPARALGDLTGIKKHFCRKHGEKKWRCDRCPKAYAVHSDLKAHLKTCGSRQYTCDCGLEFARKDSFVNHRGFCEALAEEGARLSANSGLTTLPNQPTNIPPFTQFPENPPPSFSYYENAHHLHHQLPIDYTFATYDQTHDTNPNPNPSLNQGYISGSPSLFQNSTPSPPIQMNPSAISPYMNQFTAIPNHPPATIAPTDTTMPITHFGAMNGVPSSYTKFSWNNEGVTRNFLGLNGEKFGQIESTSVGQGGSTRINNGSRHFNHGGNQGLGFSTGSGTRSTAGNAKVAYDRDYSTSGFDEPPTPADSDSWGDF